jgi:hypothetical protein
MKYGLAVSTFSDETTSDVRYEIIEECFQSLLDNVQRDTEVIITADGPLPRKHLDIFDKYKIKVLTRSENGGGARVKNIAMKYFFDKGINQGLLLDDDMLVGSPYLTEYYCHQMRLTGICHFSYRTSFNDRQYIIYNGHPIIKTKLVNGCLMSFDKTLIDKVGWFKPFNFKVGHWHTNFTMRCRNQRLIPYFCDIIGAHDLAVINQKSWENTSFNVDRSRIKENFNYISHLNKYVSYSG